MRRVVVTGIGLITPIGNSLEETWGSLLAGKSGAGPITLFDTTNFATKFGCEVKNFDATPWFDKREIKHVALSLCEWLEHPVHRLLLASLSSLIDSELMMMAME